MVPLKLRFPSHESFGFVAVSRPERCIGAGFERAMAKQYATRDAAERKARPVQKPIAGTKLIREYQGVEHCVTVRADDFEYLGRPYKSLSSIAREITGTKWNGLVFFGLKRHPGRT